MPHACVGVAHVCAGVECGRHSHSLGEPGLSTAEITGKALAKIVKTSIEDAAGEGDIGTVRAVVSEVKTDLGLRAEE